MKLTTISILISIVVASGCGDDGASMGQADATKSPDATANIDAASSDARLPCEPNPCLNGGTCTMVADMAQCDCTGTGFMGNTCETKLPAAISVNFDDTATVAVTDMAGSPATVGWNNALGAGTGQGDNGEKADLLGEDGVATGVSLSWSCQDIEVTTITAGPAGDQAMMANGCRSWMGMGDASITFANLNTHFPSGYDVVVYIGRGGGFPTNHMATFSVDVGSNTVTGAVMPSFDGTYDSLDGAGDPGNQLISAAYTDNSLTIALAATGAATLPTAAVNGIQIRPR